MGIKKKKIFVNQNNSDVKRIGKKNELRLYIDDDLAIVAISELNLLALTVAVPWIGV